MTEIVFLGTSGYLPTVGRDNTAFLVETGATAILVDCPGSVIRKVLAAGRPPLDIDSVFITHTHPDHVYGLPALVHGMMLREHVFRVYGSAESVDLCRRLLDLFGLREAKYKTRVDFVAMAPGRTETLAGGVEAAAWPVSHRPSSLAFELRPGEDGLRLVFSGDTAVHAPLFDAARGADALVHDCGAPARFFDEYPALRSVHTSARELGEWSERAGVRLLAPVHFLTELDFRPAEVEKEIRERFTGRLVVPSDGDRVAVG